MAVPVPPISKPVAVGPWLREALVGIPNVPFESASIP